MENIKREFKQQYNLTLTDEQAVAVQAKRQTSSAITTKVEYVNGKRIVKEYCGGILL